ncbi:hypothetical protein FACS1894111_12650 [Clostridia bacterium]|nr:hypothetical protein FACS1894111_12650 [Clostridia bacterium]
MKWIEPKEVAAPVSYTYLIWKKYNADISAFNQLFESFIAKERMYDNNPPPLQTP